ncbi:MAG: hypothetical protein JJU18_05605 [Oceanicaulis sp.]|nr:hypothetical protein [Oceanicaulis sp.]
MHYKTLTIGAFIGAAMLFAGPASAFQHQTYTSSRGWVVDVSPQRNEVLFCQIRYPDPANDLEFNLVYTTERQGYMWLVSSEFDTFGALDVEMTLRFPDGPMLNLGVGVLQATVVEIALDVNVMDMVLRHAENAETFYVDIDGLDYPVRGLDEPGLITRLNQCRRAIER